MGSWTIGHSAESGAGRCALHDANEPGSLGAGGAGRGSRRALGGGGGERYPQMSAQMKAEPLAAGWRGMSRDTSPQHYLRSRSDIATWRSTDRASQRHSLDSGPPGAILDAVETQPSAVERCPLRRSWTSRALFEMQALDLPAREVPSQPRGARA